MRYKHQRPHLLPPRCLPPHKSHRVFHQRHLLPHLQSHHMAHQTPHTRTSPHLRSHPGQPRRQRPRSPQSRQIPLLRHQLPHSQGPQRHRRLLVQTHRPHSPLGKHDCLPCQCFGSCNTPLSS
ncbi:hypothetical protein MT325_m561R [Paramecium bursaria chlorella virus MT325]|uniref:Uncharacterized protein m561R n=1 Tax=Paramecium bursaria Chlorella virus MT325 TaxID=346932 RepID=A7IUU1_PBCVM|nr:hypothetical protein MT325_m561R [Paramecium bursaria chlorella virus MT325]